MKQLILFFALMFVSFGAWSQTDSSTLILRADPYLQNPTDGSITVCWQTRVPCHSYVEWGSDTLNLNHAHTLIAGQVISNNTLNKIRVEGLAGGDTYFYRIVSRHIRSYGGYSKTFGGTYTSPFYSFTLPDDKQKDFDLLIFNDIHQHTSTMDTLMSMVRSKELAYDFVIFNGDCIDDPQSEDQAVSTISHLNRAVGSTDKPVIYMRGNHEIRNAYSMDLTRLFDYTGGQSYGAMNWGDTRIVMLDCGEDKPDDHWVYYGLNDFTGFRADQLQFLKAEHKSTAFKKAKKRILINHIPLWGLDETYNPCLELWGKELAAQPYAISINAHTHNAKLYQTAEQGNPFPVLIGGGYKIDDATVIQLCKRGEKMNVQCFNAQGDVLYSLDL